MNAVSSRPGSPALRLGARALTVSGSYLVTALVVLVVIVILRHQLAPESLRDALSFFFIASLAAGLEPGTVKAALLRDVGGESASRIGAPAYLVASALKGIAAAPLLALVWRIADPHVETRACIWLPFVAVAGFAATDLRVLFDVQGRHALAVWLKQGSLGGGLLVLAALIWAGVPLFWAMGASTAPRLVLVVVVAMAESRRDDRPALVEQVRWLLIDVRWLELAGASVIAAVGGSADRVLALRYLAPAAYAAYYLLYEVFSRFWLLPYLLSPIIFARRAAGQAAGEFIRGAWRLTAAAGAVFLAGVVAAFLLTPGLMSRIFGISLGPMTLAFAAAVVIASFTQLRIAELQGAGGARRATVLMALGAMVSTMLFFTLVRRFAAPGLLAAWLIKSGFELVTTMIWGRRGLADKPV